MSERPILFSGPMVRALLDGRKTQTRRVVKPQPPSPEAVRAKAGDDYHWLAPKPGIDHWRPAGPVWAVRDLMGREPGLRCPYGVPGDRLWVRETWGCKHADRPGVPDGRKPQPGDSIQYAANDADAWQWRDGSLPWRPSIHMPRWASRLTLELTGVRVERVQDISADDARAEGFDDSPELGPRQHFIGTWTSLNGVESWHANPWVWVLGFSRVAA